MKRPPPDELISLCQATVAAEGTTTAPGAAAGNSIVDAGLIGAGANSFFSMLMVVYSGQPRLVDSMDITGFNNGTGEVIFDRAYKGIAAAIPAGVPYKIVTFRFVPAEVAAIEAKLDAFSILQETGGTVLATGGEDNVMLVNAPPFGVFWPHKVQIDLGLMVAGDNTIIRLYYRIAIAPAALLLKDQITYNGVQAPKLINVELEPNRFGFWVSLEQTAQGVGGFKHYAYDYFFED